MQNYDDIKLEIFESYENGEITEAERDELLDRAYMLESYEEDDYVEESEYSLDDIKLEILEAYENGEISEEDKDELLLEAYSLEYEDDDDSFTLEEAMDYIDDYLTEGFLNKKSKGSRLSAKDRAIDAINADKADRDAEKYMSSYKNKATNSNVDKKIKHLKKGIDMYKSSIADTEKKHNNSSKFKNIRDKSIRNDRKYLSRDVAELKYLQSKFGKKPGTKLESVDDLRLRVYEAYEEGVISEYDKDTFLEYLDLENYE